MTTVVTDQTAKTLLFKKVKLNKTKPSEISDVLSQHPNIDINVKNAWGKL